MGKAGRRSGGCDSLDVAALWPASPEQIGFPIPNISRELAEQPTQEEEPGDDGIW